MIYFVILFFVYFLAPLNKKRIVFSQNNLGSKVGTAQGKLIYFYFFTFILICICGLRSVKIGLDTPQYYFLFRDASKFQNLFDFISHIKKDREHPEWGYIVYEWCLSLIGNYNSFLFVTAIITILPLMWLIYKYSKIPWLSIALFILFGYFTFYMSTLRQAIALAFCFFAFHYSLQNKLLKYLFCLFLAFLFHQTAIVFFPIYWIKKIPLNRKVLFATIILIVSSFVIRNYIYLLFLSVSRTDYTEHIAAGGFRMYITMLLVIGIGFISMKEIKANELNKKLFYMMIVCAFLWPILSIGSPALYRLYYYYHIFIILFSANLAMSIKLKLRRNIVILFFVLIGSAYFITQVVYGELNVYPYNFNWEVPVNFNTLQHSWEEKK